MFLLCQCYVCASKFSVIVLYTVGACVFNVWKMGECVCSSPQAAPSTLGCRSTHSSPVHSASSRLSQGFSVSVPTLLFAGMKPRHRSSEAPRARQCRQVPHDPHDPATDLSPPPCSSLADSYDITRPPLPSAAKATSFTALKHLWPISELHSAVTHRV